MPNVKTRAERIAEINEKREAARKPIKLCVSSETEQTAAVSLVANLLDAAQSKINHIDQLRQKNFSNALLLFGGLFGFSTALPHGAHPSVVLAILSILMIVLTVNDRKLHVISHGWQYTRYSLVQKYNELLTLTVPSNTPQTVTVQVYYKDGEEHAEPFSVVPVLFYLLAIGACALSVLGFAHIFQLAVSK